MHKGLKGENEYLLQCTPLPDITNTHVFLLQYSIKVYVKEVLEFNGGHVQAEQLCVIYISLSLH